MQDTGDFEIVLQSRIPLVVLETHDENRAMDLLQRVARSQELPLYRWTITDGLEAAGFGLRLESEAEHAEPEGFLRYLKTRAKPGIYALCDFHPWIKDHPTNIRLLKDIALRNEHGGLTLVLISHTLNLPEELGRFSARFQLSLPDHRQILDLVREEAAKWSRRNDGQRVRTESEILNKLAANLRGLTHAEVRRLSRRAIVDDGAITDSDLAQVNDAKFKLMNMDGVLSYEFDTEDFTQIAGMDRLKGWLEVRRQILLSNTESTGADMPRGILLLGVQGGGKSLAAKAVAGTWGLPLLRMDMGALYNKFFGETERNLRDSLDLADRMSPCVLWIDEIEKGLAADSGDSGISHRVLGTLLTWMSERKSRVFLVATANDISRLPAELVRKGRFDELFFVDLPDSNMRENIFAIHLRRRQLDPALFQLDDLAAASEGFSGAEIEQAVIAAVYSEMANGAAVGQASVREQLDMTSPLSVVMREKLQQLRQWARERNVINV